MRKRVDQLGVAQPEIQRFGDDEIDVALPEVNDVGKRRTRGRQDRPAVLLRLGAERDRRRRQAAPTEATVTGGREAGAATYGLTEYQAVLRAEKRPAELRKNDTTWEKGCTPEQVNGCIYGSWYLLDTQNEKVVCPGGAAFCGPAETEKNLYENIKPPKDAKLKAVRVNPGTVLVQARATENAAGKVTQDAEQLLRAQGRPGADRRRHHASPAGLRRRRRRQRPAERHFGFTGHGKKVFEGVTKEIAHRGQEAQLPGVAKEAAQQHFAVVARRPADHDAVDRLHEVPGRDRRLARLGDLRRLHDHLGAENSPKSCSPARCRSSSS